MIRKSKAALGPSVIVIAILLRLQTVGAGESASEPKDWRNELYSHSPDGEIQQVIEWVERLELGIDLSAEAMNGFSNVLDRLSEIYPKNSLVAADAIKIEDEEKEALKRWPKGMDDLYLFYLRTLESSWQYWQETHPGWERVLFRPDDDPEKWGTHWRSVDATFPFYFVDPSAPEFQKMRLEVKRLCTSPALNPATLSEVSIRRIDAVVEAGYSKDYRKQLPSLRKFTYRKIELYNYLLQLRTKFKSVVNSATDPQAFDKARDKVLQDKPKTPDPIEVDFEGEDSVHVPEFYDVYVQKLFAFELGQLPAEQFERSFDQFRSEIYAKQDWPPEFLIAMQGDELRGLDALSHLGTGVSRENARSESERLTSMLLNNPTGKLPHWLTIRGDIETLLQFYRKYKRIAEQNQVEISSFRRLSDFYRVKTRKPEVVLEKIHNRFAMDDEEIAGHVRHILAYAERRRDGAIKDIYVRLNNSRNGRVWFLNNIQRDGGLANATKMITLDSDGVVDK